MRVRAHKVGTQTTGDDMVSAIELLGVSRASASGVICGGADIIASYDILGWHQVSHWKPFMPAFTLLLTFMCLTSFQVLDADMPQQCLRVTILHVHRPQTASPLLARSHSEKAAVMAVHLACGCASCIPVNSIDRVSNNASALVKPQRWPVAGMSRA
jgi:hypothetical protein